MFPDTDYPALPYPGARPDRSFVHDDGTGWPLRPDRAALSGWRLASGEDLDDWLAARGAAPLAGRVPVLCYGSNACPSKLTWLRGTLGLVGPAVLARARCTGLAAVWAAGLRVVDDQRPATLTAMPEATEPHAVWFATPEQVRVLDRCEGRGDRYRLVRVVTGEVRLAGGALVEPLAYVAARATQPRHNRYPLLVDGRPVRCADVPQAAAAALVGEPAAGDGLAVLAVDGEPVPEDHPGRVFVYGTLRPDASHWPMLAPYAAGVPRRAELAGTLFDTGLGYPALRLGGPGVAGWVVELTAPAAALSILDTYEGREYRRTRVTLDDDTVAWAYVWIDPFDGMSPLTTHWGTT
ncbi:gamma-glutamylcyclotransferase [Actinophytocola gossypii]|uniref:Gamma-glutamylcyclotransferase n=1 Tax=Actinophytocola gossypii TaxID=2812003 RepID=A0ABT2J4G1_9PSEU|nr:gamma-glutamylcyclotransferase [Actinophytocola gossypii]MCT2582757.1 gamma-glutamylcyclotransferase [Actinophytocola gossypii]